MKKILFGFLILLGFASCEHKSKIESKNLIDITSKIDKSTGFIDLSLSITDTKENDSTFVYIAKGLYKNDTVGIKISLKKNLKAGIVNGEMKNVFVKNGISINSIGKQSDKLLTTMTELYKVDSINKEMKAESILLTCANLNQENINYDSGEYKFKVFMETEEDNSELFINFDFTNHLILLNEKDNEYRKGILKYLMKK